MLIDTFLTIFVDLSNHTVHFQFSGIEEVAKLPLSQVIGQQVTIDLWTNVKDTWSHLLETGQLWAFLIGLGAGWWLKSLLP